MMNVINTNTQTNNNGHYNNTNLNSRQPNYQNTRGSITGDCERSVADDFNKIESSFLEKYLKYIIQDDFIPDLFEINLDKFQQVSNSKAEMSQSIFQVAKNFNLQSFIDQLRTGLKKNSNINQNQLIIKCYGQDHQIQQGDYVFIACQIKISNQKLKKLPEMAIELLEKSIQSDQIKLGSNQLIHMTIFYNGDINFDFNKFPDQYFQDERVIELNKCKVRVIMNIFYISKVALFQHFAQRNNYNIQTVDDKTITFYELTRISFKQRQIAILQFEKQKQTQQIQCQNKTNNQNKGSNQKQQLKQSEMQEQLNQQFGQFSTNEGQQEKGLKYYVLGSIKTFKNRKFISLLLVSTSALFIFYGLKRILKKQSE